MLAVVMKRHIPWKQKCVSNKARIFGSGRHSGMVRSSGIHTLSFPQVSSGRGRLLSSEAVPHGELLQRGQGNQPWGLEAGELLEDLVMLREGVVSHSGSGNGCSLLAKRRPIPPPQTEHGLNLNELKLSFPSLSGSNKHPKGLQSQRARNDYSFHFTHFHLLPEVLVLQASRVPNSF